MWLRRLVMALTLVMILGFLVLIGAIVIRLNAEPLPLPDRITLPDGESPRAFTQGSDWFAVVTDADRILVFDRATARLRQTVEITTAD